MNYRSGRAIAQLAVRSALRREAPWSAAFGGPATAPQPAAASPPAKPFRSGIASQSFIKRAKPQTGVWGLE
ncbi:hypothetical protein SGRA_0915 [Saprospira grandis str. Lewin]|uniref:Uncharacterized protein n=1 Tax=Saprospira grandis (strain Lewin) TaxID=984262 RepID=H6L2J3_SAPGL|nr:hypothetical protein SGRA_0915 [Saprospira grandis str. Lewin]